MSTATEASNAIEWAKFAASLAAPFVAVLGGLLLFHLREKSERERGRDRFVADKLLEAYQLVVDALEIPGMDPELGMERKRNLEKAINLIDLYADPEMKRIADEIVKGFQEGKPWIVYDPLLTKFRDSFREHMGLTPLDGPVKTVKFQLVKNEEQNKS